MYGLQKQAENGETKNEECFNYVCGDRVAQRPAVCWASVYLQKSTAADRARSEVRPTDASQTSQLERKEHNINRETESTGPQTAAI